eukprot:TRINITY_DN4329_c0_g1_i1.p1 TRINITY_DN4329_c0_g1~~TRINITY_DN4329_c0_g1_i1.p1  ORF type:complete len:1562 (-),score=375.52 TRINITY_DN4329_c0_g1_i1:179-4864(-)
MCRFGVEVRLRVLLSFWVCLLPPVPTCLGSAAGSSEAFEEGEPFPAWLQLEDGTVERGQLLGARKTIAGEYVFTTAMVGYVESLTDPSYYGQIVVFTYPMVGNYGVPRNDSDYDPATSPFESARIQAAGVVVADCAAAVAPPAHREAHVSFARWLELNGVPGLCGVDTRALTKHLRHHGTLRGQLRTSEPGEGAVASATSGASNLVAAVSAAEPQVFGRGGSLRIAVLDCGAKGAIVKRLLERGDVEVHVLPWDFDLASPKLPTFHGLLVSNGPGDPTALPERVVAGLRRELNARQPRPIFSICLGHQLLALAAGAKVVKLPYGNRGHNQPVKDLFSGRLYMSAQNHGYAVDASTLPDDWRPYFVNLNDGTNEGIIHRTKPFSSVQFHPEATGGPDDTGFLLGLFVEQARAFQSRGEAPSIASMASPLEGGLSDQSSVTQQQPAVQPDKVPLGSKVLLIGSGATRIGQAGEFDYAGIQAIKALKEQNMTVVLVNPNVASVQTQVGVADHTYLLPVTPEYVERVIERERPFGILLSFGGQTALNCGLELEETGVLAKYGVRVLGTPTDGIRVTEDRDLFKRALEELGQPFAQSVAATTLEEALAAARKIGYPVILRSAFALGGLGSGFADNEEELKNLASSALASSPQVLVEQSLRGWKEVEYEVVRDGAGNTMTVCNMENLDPVGIHTGESMVVAPSQTLTNEEYFMLRNAAIRIIQHVGVVGECNIQFGLDPWSLRYVVIEVNPRLSRSSALASKATGYPLAYIAAKIALGLRLDELSNAVTRKTSAFFEPALDYLVVKVPRWDFDKFPKVKRVLGSSMKSIGESMGIGRSLCEALQKGLRMSRRHLGLEPPATALSEEALLQELSEATDRFVPALVQALAQGNHSLEALQNVTRWDMWVLRLLQGCVQRGEALRGRSLEDVGAEELRRLKQDGYSDDQIASRLRSDATAQGVRAHRLQLVVRPVVKQIDTMAAEFPAFTNYLYVTYYGNYHDIQYSKRVDAGVGGTCDPGSSCGAVMVVGSGTYHVGSSVEFDSSGVSCTRTLRKLGFPTIMVNYNPETVSTDYDESDRLYFDEISLERLLDIAELERPMGLILSMGGQISNNLMMPLHRAGLPIMGTHPTMVDNAEDRSKHSALLDRIGVDQPRWQRFADAQGARNFASEVGYPVLVRPSYVLSGAAMAVVREASELERYLRAAASVSPEHPVVISEFWLESKELDVDVVAHQGELLLYAVSEHIEEAGVHSGDATMVFPSESVGTQLQRRLKSIVASIAKELNITGAFNIQALSRGDRLAVIETNLRASRSLPFVSKVLGVDFAAAATRAIVDRPPAYQPLCDAEASAFRRVGVKAPQFSFRRLPGADPTLGVEMRSTGEVASLDPTRAGAVLKALVSAGLTIPPRGAGAWLSLPSGQLAPDLALALATLFSVGWRPVASADGCAKIRAATAALRRAAGDEGACEEILDVEHLEQPALAQALGEHGVRIAFELSGLDSQYVLRRTAVDFDIPLITNTQQFLMLFEALSDMKEQPPNGTHLAFEPLSLQEHLRSAPALVKRSGERAEL